MLKTIVFAVRALFAPPPPPPKATAAEIDAKLIAKRDSNPKYAGLDPVGSMVDLLKVFDQPSSKEARAEIWYQMGFKDQFIGSVEQNTTMMAKFRDVLADDQHPF